MTAIIDNLHYNKIVFPSTTEQVILNFSSKLIEQNKESTINEYTSCSMIFDLRSFNTSLHFNLELEYDTEDIEDKEFYIEQGINFCKKCPHYMTDYFDKYAIFSEEQYYEYSENLNMMQDIVPFLLMLEKLIKEYTYNKKQFKPSNSINILTNISEILYLLEEVRDNYLEEITSNTDLYTVSELERICLNYLDYCDEIKEKIVDVLNNIKYIPEEVFNISDRIYSKYFSRYNIYREETDQCLIYFNDWELDSIVINSQVSMSRCISHIEKVLLSNIATLYYSVVDLKDNMEIIKSCPGVEQLYVLEDCSKIPLSEQIYRAYDAINDLSFNSSSEEEFTDTINLTIPDHYYYINLRDFSIHIFGEIELNQDKLLTYPILLPNTYSNGCICFSDNEYIVDSNIINGKFSNIIEIFWSSDFNHDLIELESSYTRNTIEYHNELLQYLDSIYNTTNSKDYINKKKENAIGMYNINTLECFSLSTYDFYIREKTKDSVDIAIVNKIDNTIHKEFRVYQDFS